MRDSCRRDDHVPGTAVAAFALDRPAHPAGAHDDHVVLRRVVDVHLLDLADRVGQFRSRGVIIDVTVLDVIDSFATRMLRAVAHMLKLRGAETVIVGIQPDVAFAMVQLGLTLEGVGTALDLEEGLAYLDRLTKRTLKHAK